MFVFRFSLLPKSYIYRFKLIFLDIIFVFILIFVCKLFFLFIDLYLDMFVFKLLTPVYRFIHRHAVLSSDCLDFLMFIVLDILFVFTISRFLCLYLYISLTYNLISRVCSDHYIYIP